METWQEVFTEKIPKDTYQIKMTNGEENGLVIELYNNHTSVFVKFGIVLAVRMLDEGLAQEDVYSDKAIAKYKTDNFSNIIYEVHNGEFLRQVDKISRGYSRALNAKHYVLVAQNYNVDIIAEWEPIIEIVLNNEG